MDLHKFVILREKHRKRLLEQLEKDTKFLASHDIMDYSLLLGNYYTLSFFFVRSCFGLYMYDRIQNTQCDKCNVHTHLHTQTPHTDIFTYYKHTKK